jgi:hypothetical protein
MTRAPVEVAGGLAASALAASVVLAAANALPSIPVPSSPVETAACQVTSCAPEQDLGASSRRLSAAARDSLLSRPEPRFVEVDPALVDPRDSLVICTSENGVAECIRAPS